MLDKVQFHNGTIVNVEYLNEVQKGSSFSAGTNRSDFYSEPTSIEHAGWKIGQRDSLKDWEVADPREDKETAIGRLAHDGIVLKSYNPTTLAKEIGPPTLVQLGTNPTIYGVWVEAGSIISSDGQPISWEIQSVALISGEEINYIYIDEAVAKANIAASVPVQLSIGPALPSVSVPHIPLAKLVTNSAGSALATDSDGEVVGTGYVDLRPGLYVGSLNTYPRILKNTGIKVDSYSAKSWERVIADTSNGSLIVSLPATPTDSDRVAIVDISGTFDRFPIVIRPGGDTKIANSVDDWIINIKDAHIELFYHSATSEWKFEETPGGDCSPVLGTFLSCGGREFVGQRLAEECPDGQTIPAVYPNPPDGVYRYEVSSSKCYKEFYQSVAVYADGQGGLIKVQNAPRCDRTGTTIDPTVKNIIYVDPAVGDDSVNNNGFAQTRPFRSVERALVEAVRESRRAGQYNDRYDKIVIELAPGDYYVDNSPGAGSVSGLSAETGLVQRVPTGFKVLNREQQDRALVIYVDSLSPTLSQPPRTLSLGRILYSQSGGVGNISKVEKESLSSSIWKITLEYVKGDFPLDDNLYYDNLSLINPTGGGLIVPRGISVNGVDTRKVRVRPMYVPELNPIEEEPQRDRTSIFKVTGGSYISLITFTDNPQISRSHNTVTAIGFASQSEIVGSSVETSYYSKLNSLFGQYDGWGSQGLEAIQAETTIVAPIYDSKNLRQTDSEENQTGFPAGDSRVDSPISYPGASKIKNQGSGDQRVFDLPDINSTRSSSPYVFNCSVRSIFGMNGLHADGALVSGFRSMVTANFTQVSLQTDPTCYTNNTYYLDPPTNKEQGTGKQYRPCPADPFKYRHFGFKGSNNATIQIVSCFVIGNADHFVSESGSDLSITNSCSDFGDISLHAVGYKTRSFSQDEGVPSGSYGGTKISQIVPPRPLSYSVLADGSGPTLVDTEINTGLVLDYELTKTKYISESVNGVPPSLIKVYVKSSNTSSPFSATGNVPSSSKMGFGQFTYTIKKSDGTYELSGGSSRANRKRLYIKGFDEKGNSILYTGDIQLALPSYPGFNELDDSSKIFVWDTEKSQWYVNVSTSTILEELEDVDGDGYLLKRINYAFRYKILQNPTPTELSYSSLDFLFQSATISTVRGIDKRKSDERIYRIVLEGFIKDEGMRRPQNYYILEKQLGVNGYPLNGSSTLLDDPLTISQIRDYDEVFDPEAYRRRLAEKGASDGRFVAYLTQGTQARKVSSGDLYPALNYDEPEQTADPVGSITRIALSEMINRPGVYIPGVIEPGVNPVPLKVRSTSASSGILIGLRRPSVIRASGHTWEWTGYLNYDTAFPTFQGEPLEQDFALGKIIVESNGGKVYATGMNEEGSFYIGTTVFDLRTGEQFAIPLEADNEPGSVTNQVFNSVVVKSSLALNDDASVYFGADTKIYFDSKTSFNTTTGPITANQTPLPEVYASTTKAGLVQLADTSTIRGSKVSGNVGAADKLVVTAAALSNELKARFDNAIEGGTGIEVTSASVELPGGDPNTPDDNITRFTVSAKEASETQKGIIEIATADEVREFTSTTLAVTPATLIQAIGDSIKNVVNLRLSLSSTLNVPSETIPESDKIYVHPWNGNEIALYDSTTQRWFLLKFPTSTLPSFELKSGNPAVALTADTTFDVYLYNSGTLQAPVLAMDFQSWGGNTTPPTRGSKDGIPHKSGDPTRRLVGIVRTTATAGKSIMHLGGTYYTSPGTGQLDAADYPKLYLANLHNQYDARAIYFFGNGWNSITNGGAVGVNALWKTPPVYLSNARVSFVQASSTLVTAFLDIYNNPPGDASIAYVAPGIDVNVDSDTERKPPSDAFYGENQTNNTTAGSQWARSLTPGLHNIHYLYQQSGNSVINEHANHGMIVIAKV
jgi:hypothetical protein